MALIDKSTKKYAENTHKDLVSIETGSLLLLSSYCLKFKLVPLNVKYVAVSIIIIYSDV
jgi:hypothetical protein